MRPDEEEAGTCDPGIIITVDLKAMAAANLAWNEPEDPMDLASPCPVCGSEPAWSRAGWHGRSRYLLKCCEVEGNSVVLHDGMDNRDAEMTAVLSWNQEAAWAKDGIELDRQEAEREKLREAEDRWADEHLPALA